jgi:hypothetical protein
MPALRPRLHSRRTAKAVRVTAVKMFEAEDDQIGKIRLEWWPEGFVLWAGGEIVWTGWDREEKKSIEVLGEDLAARSL